MAEQDEKKSAKKLAKVERARFHATFYERGQPKYEAGKHYPVTPETESQIVAGNAKKESVEMDADEHAAESESAEAAHRHANRATLAAEGDARKRGELK
jgi:hypothetical protein